MKLVDMTCPQCGARLTVDADLKTAKCEYCGSMLLIDDEVQHIEVDNAYKAGYEFEKGRQQAQAEHRAANEANGAYPAGDPGDYRASDASAGRRRTWLWVLGWIFIYPVPLTILMLRNKTLPNWARYAIIAAGWLTYFYLVYANR